MTQKKYTIKSINKNIKSSLNQFILKSELGYKNQIESVSQHIAENPLTKFVMIAGPSSAGKTTTANLLALSLNKLGINTRVLSLDDFFVEREETPLWEDGTYNYESVNAIDWKLFDECVSGLLNKKEVVLPTYNFVTGKKQLISKAKLLQNDIIIIEGLHALNKIIDNFIPKTVSVKIYISVFSSITNNGKTVLNKMDIRLLRRMVRDMRCRGTMPKETLINWTSVNRGEKIYIHPFKKTANFFIDSFHPYELCIYKKMLNDYKNLHKEELPVVDKLLKDFYEVNAEVVPKQSLLREFVG